MDLEKVLVCGEELLIVLVRNEEAATWKNIQDMSQQVADLKQRQLQQLKHDVQYLTSELNMASDASSGSGDSSGPQDNVADLEASLMSRVETARSQSAHVIKECHQAKEELMKAQRELQSSRDQRLTRKEAKTAALPKARCDVNLYSNITNLRWQFNCEPHEVKGYICNNDVKTFSLNAKEVSRFFITNYIWDLIEENW